MTHAFLRRRSALIAASGFLLMACGAPPLVDVPPLIEEAAHASLADDAPQEIDAARIAVDSRPILAAGEEANSRRREPFRYRFKDHWHPSLGMEYGARWREPPAARMWRELEACHDALIEQSFLTRATMVEVVERASDDRTQVLCRLVDGTTRTLWLNQPDAALEEFLALQEAASERARATQRARDEGRSAASIEIHVYYEHAAVRRAEKTPFFEALSRALAGDEAGLTGR